MEAPAELLSALPALVTVLALLLAWLLVRRGAAPAPPVSPEPPAEASVASEPPQPRAPEPAAAPEERLEEPAAALTEVEEATEARQEEELDPAGEKNLPGADEPEEEEDEVGEGTFSFKYSPGKLRGNQYKQMMTKEELEEEQRTEE